VPGHSALRFAAIKRNRSNGGRIGYSFRFSSSVTLFRS